MLTKKRHKFKFTDNSLKRIDWFLPKLKYSVLPSKIVNWLENFEEEELPLVYDFLQVFEYISFNEFQYRLEDKLKAIFKELHEEDKVLVIPFGKFGKSGTLVSYPLTHSPFYIQMKRAKRIQISHDFEKFTKEKIDSVIFLDDFIGSGNTFCNEFKKIKPWVDKKGISKRFILSAIIMHDGKKKIKTKYADIQVFAQERFKLFELKNSAFKALGDTKKYELLSTKYENLIRVKPDYLKGYSGSESLIAFTHGTPNNTLPIFWWSNNWKPLFPRHAKIRMDEAREFKKEIAFYIGICNRLGIDLIELDKRIDYEKKHETIEKSRKYNTHAYHSVLALIKLKLERVEDYIISQILGLTEEELEEVYENATALGFIDLTRALTNKAHAYIKKLQRKIAKENFREPTDEHLEMKKIIYVPSSFKDLT